MRSFAILASPRHVLALASVLALAPVACTKSEPLPPEAPTDPRPPTPAAWDREVTRPSDADADKSRAECAYGRGALADETLGVSVRMGKDIPIETIVVIMQENRSFDHYFGRFGRYAGRTDIAVPPDTAQNPERTGDVSSATIPWQRAGHYCFLDTNHEWEGTHHQIDDGKMDGFYETNHDIPGEVMPDPTMALRDGARAMWWYDERELPYYYALAKEFGLADHYFSSVPGPTWPNRMFLNAGTSFGLTENMLPRIEAYPFPDEDIVIQDELEKRHVDWRLYSDGPPSVAAVLGFQLTNRWGDVERKFTMDDLFADAAAGRLPPVVYIDPNALNSSQPDGEDEHPPAHLQVGQSWIAGVLGALMKSPQWKTMAIFLTYDEHGGLYDHLPPPKACEPDDMSPIDAKRNPVEGRFDMYGVRVPLLVMSPFSKRGYIAHGVYDHTSILRLIQAKHRLPALTRRDANANIPLEFFDFDAPPNPSVPALPAAVIEDGELAYCRQTFSR